MALTDSASAIDLQYAALVAGNELELNGPYRHLLAVTPDDSDDIDFPEGIAASRGLFVGASGTVKLDTLGGETVTLAAIAGYEYRIQVTRVYTTGTSATGIVVGY